MAMICMSCGESESFTQEAQGRAYVYVDKEIDGETEETTDEEITDWEDFDNESDDDEIRCQNCDSDNIRKGLKKSEINRIKWEHTDKDGEWSEEELDKKERDDKLLIDEI